MSTQDEFINDTYNQLAVIITNDIKLPYTKMGNKIINCTSAVTTIEQYFDLYPPLLDISELGASLEYEGTTHQEDVVRQIKYKLQQLKSMLPDIR